MQLWDGALWHTIWVWGQASGSLVALPGRAFARGVALGGRQGGTGGAHAGGGQDSHEKGLCISYTRDGQPALPGLPGRPRQCGGALHLGRHVQ